MENTSACTYELFQVSLDGLSQIFCYLPLSGLPHDTVKAIQPPTHRPSIQSVLSICLQLSGVLFTLKTPTDIPGS